MEKIKTLDELADMINNEPEFPVLAVKQAIKENNWEEGENDYDIAINGTEVCAFDEKGVAIVFTR